MCGGGKMATSIVSTPFFLRMDESASAAGRRDTGGPGEGPFHMLNISYLFLLLQSRGKKWGKESKSGGPIAAYQDQIHIYILIVC